MSGYVLDFSEINQESVSLVGGKGANLGELYRLDASLVPPGFCLTTQAYLDQIAGLAELVPLFDRLDSLAADDLASSAATAAQIRVMIEQTALSEPLRNQIHDQFERLGPGGAYAVRSSATAEDLPTASFAGQQDTYLNVIGEAEILRQIARCWASLYTERAVSYRARQRLDRSQVAIAVVVQQMVRAEAAGVMFSADPLSGDRRISVIDASFGLGEAIVSGLVTADNYRVQAGTIVDKRISAKTVLIDTAAGGGTTQQGIESARQRLQVLSDADIVRLEGIGRRVEAHFGSPQDIEWCLKDKEFYLVQARPITTLYPLPDVSDSHNHVYLSFGHQQMMTDAIKPFGISFFELTDDGLMTQAGGRLFMDISHDLASGFGRALAGPALKLMDPLVGDANQKLMKRRDYLKTLPRGKRFLSMGSGYFSFGMVTGTIGAYRHNDPDLVNRLIADKQPGVEQLRADLEACSRETLFDAIVAANKRLLKIIADPQGMGAIWMGVYASNWVNKHLKNWLGIDNAADQFTQALPNNISSAMALALLDVADVVRPYHLVIEYFSHPDEADFFAGLAGIEGGDEVAAALNGFLGTYGMRGPGEIDISRPRWNEQPAGLAAMILSNIRNFEPGARRMIVERGLAQAEKLRREVVEKLRATSGGAGKAKKAKRMIAMLRNYMPYREYPKHLMMQHYWIMKQALVREAAGLVAQGVLREVDDFYFLSFDEFRAAVTSRQVDLSLIDQRRRDFENFEKLTPPRLFTSDGEIIEGSYAHGKAPAGALVGIAVSSGSVEGRARVIARLEEADIAEGDILVTAYTDPSWTPVFVSAAALVTEVGGQMTHGAVVAREYGLPAVVGVENATRLIRDGQRIRVNGSQGYVELLS